ncbi:class I glutamine amidotransferase-like protein [Mytilinidion resinicola]|uniref:D-lactate dehydratase n=1 Tax=Mytilinidion resinicola TaxID=574789 RepID=A0A6A6YTX1_9PEZI|nr:class I glutamine amidotransferase-like protein [Mytilinidion resinicola]KAF2811833.1 class I glutamine amidotransferase-like protein [Mytilinidion resinicola]
MSPLPRRAIIAVTSATAPLHNGNPTGLFISEALHPFQDFKAAGFEVDLVSEKGTYVPDWLSQTPDFLHGDDKKQWEDLSGEFRQKLDNMPAVNTIDGSKYGIFYASAGHAALIDYPHAKGLQKIATDVWVQGGVVSAVCHGEAIFPGVIDPETGKSIIAGKTITGFTTQGEYDMHIMEPIRSWGEPLIDEWAEKLGAKYVRADGVWDDFHIVDGRVVTGMNPQSAHSTAKAALEVFEKL